MKKLIALFALASLTANADVVRNFHFNGDFFVASSTNVVSETITPLANGLIEFDLISHDCMPGVGGGGHKDDCDLTFSPDHPGEVYRTQLTSKEIFSQDTDMEFSFDFKDKSEDDGLGYHGIGVTLFELYPDWTPTRAASGFSGPTHHIWYDPKSKNIYADSNWNITNCGTCNNIPGYILSTMTDDWNKFIIKTNQTAHSNGYLTIIHNGKVIADIKGKTSYPAPQGYAYWFGAYVCCSFTKEGEPDHTFLFKNVIAQAGYVKPEPKISL